LAVISERAEGQVPAQGHPPWQGALRRALEAPVTMVIGESDTGKTTLVTALANALVERGFRVAVLDADLGQSEIGPPTTIGLGRVVAPLARLRDAPVTALHFVGATSPAGNLLGALVGVRRLLDRARAGGDERVVIDTSGLVTGDLGRALKQAKIELTDPDLVLCLERADECGGIVDGYRGLARPELIRLPASPSTRQRSPEERRLHRQRQLETYLRAARPLTLALDRVAVRTAGGPPLGARPPAEVEGAVVGLLDRAGRTLGLGIVRHVDPATRLLRVDADVPEAEVAAVVIGRERYPA
jgi:polynucleotide 5'-kinase involved in rRNA processing